MKKYTLSINELRFFVRKEIENTYGNISKEQRLIIEEGFFSRLAAGAKKAVGGLLGKKGKQSTPAPAAAATAAPAPAVAAPAAPAAPAVAKNVEAPSPPPVPKQVDITPEPNNPPVNPDEIKIVQAALKALDTNVQNAKKFLAAGTQYGSEKGKLMPAINGLIRVLDKEDFQSIQPPNLGALRMPGAESTYMQPHEKQINILRKQLEDEIARAGKSTPTPEAGTAQVKK